MYSNYAGIKQNERWSDNDLLYNAAVVCIDNTSPVLQTTAS